VTEGDAALAQVVGREFERDLVAGENPDVVLAHLAGGVRHQRVTVFERNAKTGIGQNFVHHAVHFNQFFLGHAFTSKLQINKKARRLPGFFGSGSESHVATAVSRLT
jgi:hypothetical protein